MFAHYSTLLSSQCRLVWKHWTCSMIVWYILSCVRLRLSPFSQLSFMKYTGIPAYQIFFLCLREHLYFVLITKLVKWIISHFFRVGPWNNGMRRVSNHVLTPIFRVWNIRKFCCFMLDFCYLLAYSWCKDLDQCKTKMVNVPWSPAQYVDILPV